MCGFAGFLDRDFDMPGHQHPHVVSRMAAMLKARGPDDEGVWCKPGEGLAFGFRRLAIRDLSRLGHQPMVSDRFGSAMIFNGEIYNALQLRKDLERRGETFRGESDTEVLQRCLDVDGIEATLPRLTGMFAIAYWRDADRSLSLIRDRFGIKPLFYGRIKQGLFVFASQLSALMMHPSFRPTISQDGLRDYLRFGYVPTPATIFRDICSVRPGSWMRLGPYGQHVHHQWWDSVEELPKARHDAWGLGDEERMEQLHEAIRSAVKDRLVADVPVGCFLSGGIDSSLTTAVMQQQTSRPVRSFCIGFDEADFDESVHARRVADHLGTEHEDMILTSRDMLNAVPSLSKWCDEPFADFSLIPTMLVSNLAKTQVTVALSGDGGDELCAGYVRHMAVQDWLKRVDACPTWTRPLLSKILASSWPHGLAKLGLFGSGPARSTRLQQMRKFADVLGNPTFSNVFRHHVQYWEHPGRLLGQPPEEVSGLWSDLLADAMDGPVDHGRMIDLLTYLPDDILTKVDRASMSVSLEARVPLLDQRVARAAWSLPPELMIRDGKGKWPLRYLLETYLPREMFERPKKGFSIPVSEWLRSDLREWACDLLQSSNLYDAGIENDEAIQLAMQAHLSGQADHGRKLWNILMYLSWYQSWISDASSSRYIASGPVSSSVEPRPVHIN